MPDSSAEVAIVGAGPIGIELAVLFKKSGIEYLHFDARQIGYTISWFAPQTRFFSSNDRIAIAGVPLQTADQTKCTREEYLAYLRSVVLQFDLKINTYEPVVNVQRAGPEFILTTHRADVPRTYRVQKLVLAAGGTAKPRRLNVPGEDLPHVSHYFSDPHAFFQKDVLIVGGRNSAVEAALRSHYCQARVALSYRRPQLDAASIKYWLLPEMNGLIQSGKIKGYFNTKVKEIRPGGAVLASEDGPPTDVPADFLLLLIGYEADMTLCRLAGVELQGPGQVPAFDPLTMETNVPGIYVAGTAIAGTQAKYAVFIENCHVHAQRIVASLTGAKPPAAPSTPDRPES
ncbi:MAG: NAD(P)-binding domain-containing protein [Tepidisphaeraceae bacterium]|jgi:thioredoxin reductase (NADPH)